MIGARTQIPLRTLNNLRLCSGAAGPAEEEEVWKLPELTSGLAAERSVIKL